MCTPKEPHYFSEDFKAFSFINTLDAYQSLFKERKKNHKVAGEASVWYLYSENAIENIYNYNKDARIIVMLRNPIDLFQSLHQNFLNIGFEDKEDLKEAWDYQARRKKGENIPKYCPEPNLLQYKKVIKLGDQVEKLCSIFPEKQIKFITFDDFITQTENTYKSILSFLDLKYDNRIDFPIINQRRKSKIKMLNTCLLSPPKYIKNLWKLLKSIFGNDIVKLADKVILLNSRKIVDRKDISLNFREEIKKEIKLDIVKLSSIINKDLNFWLK